jgi:sterol 14-demethylase
MGRGCNREAREDIARARQVCCGGMDFSHGFARAAVVPGAMRSDTLPTMFAVPETVKQTASTLWSALQPLKLDTPGLPPMLPGGLPVVGHAVELRTNPVAMMARGRAMFGDLFCLRLPGSLGVAMTGHAAQEKYFRFKDDEVSQREAYQLMTPVFGKGIAYDAEPHIMKEQLGFFHAALRDSRLRSYAEGFVTEAEVSFGKWGARAW